MAAETSLMIIGLLAGSILLAALIWSIAIPQKRIWPPLVQSLANQIFAWALTVIIFATAFVLGVMDWNAFQWPVELRLGLGLPLIVIGHGIVWWGVNKLGFEATSGAPGVLNTDGLYRYSRNPQYMADMAILIGWAVMSGSMLALPVVAGGVLNLLVAPLAEEPWLKQLYGDPYEQYCQRTRRYF